MPLQGAAAGRYQRCATVTGATCRNVTDVVRPQFVKGDMPSTGQTHGSNCIQMMLRCGLCWEAWVLVTLT